MDVITENEVSRRTEGLLGKAVGTSKRETYATGIVFKSNSRIEPKSGKDSGEEPSYRSTAVITLQNIYKEPLLEKRPTVKYIEGGHTKDFVYAKSEERGRNTFDHVYVRRSWQPQNYHNSKGFGELKRYTIAENPSIDIFNDKNDNAGKQTDKRLAKYNSDDLISFDSAGAHDAIDALKQILENERSEGLSTVQNTAVDSKTEKPVDSENAESENRVLGKLSPETVEKLKTKYSPSNYGYPKVLPPLTKIPIKPSSESSISPSVLPTSPQPRPRTLSPEVSPKDLNNNKPLEKPLPNPRPRSIPHRVSVIGISPSTEVGELPTISTQVTSTLDSVNASKDSFNSEFPSDIPPSVFKRHHVYLSPKRKIPIRNSAIIIKDPPAKDERQYESDTEERIIVIRHSSSEDSVDKFEEALSQFVMDKKAVEKKRSNSFKKLFRGTFFGRDKKKEDEKDRSARKNVDHSDASIDNSKNAFVRRSVHRHTVDGSYKPDHLVNGRDGADLKPPSGQHSEKDGVNRRNSKRNSGRSKSYVGDNDKDINAKHTVVPNDYTPKNTTKSNEPKADAYVNVPNVSKYIDASSSSSDSQNNTYENSLIAQAELRQVQENERKQRNARSGIPLPSNGRVAPPQRFPNESPSKFAENPPSALEIYQNIQLVKPRALIPINSERRLPNPYRYKKPNVSQEGHSPVKSKDNNEILRNNLNLELKSYVTKSCPSDTSSDTNMPRNKDKPYLNDIYGEPYDSLISDNRLGNKKAKGSLAQNSVKSKEAQDDDEASKEKAPDATPKAKSIESPLEITTSSPILKNRTSESPLSPRSRDSYIGMHDSPTARSSRSPASPLTLERTKLRLPSNREKVELQPRMKSPIPKAKVSTDKIIATELLRNKDPQEVPKNPQYQNLPEGERSKLVITRTNTMKSPIVSPTKLPRPPVQRNILTELQETSKNQSSGPTDSSSPDVRLEKISNHSPASLSPNYSYYEHTLPQKFPSSSASSPKQPNYHSVPSSSPNVSNYHLVSSSPNEANYQCSEDNLQNRLTFPPSPQESNQYLQSNVQSPLQSTPSPKQSNYQYLDQNAYVNSYGSQSPAKNYEKLSHEQLEERRRLSLDRSRNTSLMSLQNSYTYSDQRSSISNFPMPSPRSRTSLPTENPQARSPQKMQMLQNVEAFYWRELKKMKDKEEQELLNYKRLYGYVEEPAVFHRSRSTTPNMGHNTRRSLSLPREVRSTNLSYPVQPNYERIRVADLVPENAKDNLLYKRDINTQSYPQRINVQNHSEPQYVRGYFTQNPNFVRRSAGRSTIGPIGAPANIDTIYENDPSSIPVSVPQKQQGQNPIFKRGSLTSNSSPVMNYGSQSQLKKVSFGSKGESFSPSWPTKNGLTQSPPQRRMEREESLEDDVFAPNSPRIAKRSERAASEPMYSPRPPAGSITYAQVHQTTYVASPESPYGRLGQKQITITNKVCDIYGKIHDNGDRVVLSPEKYGQIKQTGVIYGKLQPNAGAGSRLSLASRQSNSNLNEYENGNFARGTRLTASVNDMYRRHPTADRQRLVSNEQRYINETMNNENVSNNYVEAPTRPLPPLPPSRRSRSDLLRKAVLRGNPTASDNDSGSEAGEVQRILQTDPRSNRISAIGK